MRVSTEESVSIALLTAVRKAKGCNNNAPSDHQPPHEGRGAGSHTGGSETAHHPNRGVKTGGVLIKLIKALLVQL